MSECDTGVRRLASAERLINVLTIISSKRYPVTTSEVQSDMKFKYGDNCCHRTVYRALEAWEQCGYVRRHEANYVSEPHRWVAMSRLVRNDYNER